MSTKKTIEKRISMIKLVLNYETGLSKSRIAHLTGLHYFTVQDVLENLKANGEVIEVDNMYTLVKREEKQ